MGSLVSYGMLAYVLVILWIHRRSTLISVLLAAAPLILAVGISRLYLGVHYFSDVVGGYAAGLLWLAACISGLEVARRWRAAGDPGSRVTASGSMHAVFGQRCREQESGRSGERLW